jgi:putative transposase
VTIKRDNNKWYAVVACEFTKPLFKFVNIQKSVGIDVGIIKFSHDSDNRVIDNPLFLSKMLKPLARADRTLSRRQKGGQNWKKAKNRLQILHERIRNRRNNFLHKLSTEYSKQYDIIFLERLHTLNMVKNHHLARHIFDSGWRTFKMMLVYKAKMVVEVPASYTSVKCYRCGHLVPKSLAVRTHRCDNCSLVIDRDFNSGVNIKQDGVELLKLPVERREVTPVEIQSESMKQELVLPVSER